MKNMKIETNKNPQRIPTSSVESLKKSAEYGVGVSDSFIVHMKGSGGGACCCCCCCCCGGSADTKE